VHLAEDEPPSALSFPDTPSWVFSGDRAVGPLGFEPRTPGLKVRSSATELRARGHNGTEGPLPLRVGSGIGETTGR
jgi:hypothetical protein